MDGDGTRARRVAEWIERESCTEEATGRISAPDQQHLTVSKTSTRPVCTGRLPVFTAVSTPSGLMVVIQCNTTTYRGVSELSVTFLAP